MEEVLDDSLLPSFINKTHQCVHRKFLGGLGSLLFPGGGGTTFSPRPSTSSPYSAGSSPFVYLIAAIPREAVRKREKGRGTS